MVLLAHPAGHSISPAMHAAAFAALGLEHRYRAVDVAPARLAEAVARLREPCMLGANVTIPHKEAVLALMDSLTPAARAIGAVNTVVPVGRALEGDNTDAEGFLAALTERGIDPVGADCVVLGAGGAARAVVWALAGVGARVQIHNRNEARARALQDAMVPFGCVSLLESGQREHAVRGCALLVNTTSVGMQGATAGSPLPEGWLPERGAVVDLVYRPPQTLLLQRARAAGLETQNGLPMLVHQGAASFRRWLELDPPVGVMRAAAEEALRPSP